MFEPKEKRHRPEASSKKRKANEEGSSEPPRKSARAESNSDESEPKTEGGDVDTSIRRSTRIREKKVDAKEKALSLSSNDPDSEPRHVSKRIHDPSV